MSVRPSKEEMSGERDNAGAPQLVLNTVRIHGSKGEFLKVDVLGGKDKDTGKYKMESLGKEVRVVFLKVRRKLSQFRKSPDKPLQTNEHGHKGQTVTLFGGITPERGTAVALREKYQGLRTQQIVYALLGDELVRVIVKGASLGSQNKDKEEYDFYSYLNSFEGDDHFYNYETILRPVAEEGPQGTYYCIGFDRGEPVSPEKAQAVEDAMYRAFDFSKRTDEYFGKGDAPVAEPAQVEADVEYPDGEVDPEDITF